MKKIAFYGGTFNSPHNGHVEIARRLAEEFDEVVVMPCGPRREKPSADMVEPIHRAVMCDMAFAGIPRVTVDLSDLEREDFTRTHEVVKRLSKNGEVWVVVGSDLLQSKDGAKSEIHTWEKGEWLWHNARFAVVDRPDYPPHIADLPNFKIFPQISNLSSSSLRQNIFSCKPIGAFIPQRVASYIKRHNLYTGRVPKNESHPATIDEPRALIFADPWNPAALHMAETLQHLEDKENPNMIIVLGGDGTMSRAIRQHWRMRLPFFGVNFGHEGFLLNPKKFLQDYDFRKMMSWQIPLLDVRVQDTSGSWNKTIAYNDAWMERDSGHTARIQVWVDGKLHEKELPCDGVLVSTAVGSTAYAMRIGLTPSFWFMPSLAMVASAVWDAPHQRSWNINPLSRIKLKALQLERGPVRAFADGVMHYKDVQEVRVRVSRIAAAEVAFHPDYDVTDRIRNIHKTLKEGK